MNNFLFIPAFGKMCIAWLLYATGWPTFSVQSKRENVFSFVGCMISVATRFCCYGPKPAPDNMSIKDHGFVRL